MTNPQGTPIWYELQTTDPAASKKFYDAVIGWNVEAQPAGDMDYRMIGTAGGGHVGGVMRLTDEMRSGGAKPGWMFYVGVDDVDASAAKIGQAGGGIVMGPWSIPGIGRMAVAADREGTPFYIMRGESETDSTAFDRTGLGKCNWNELNTPDQASANAFYGEVFGWTYPDRMSIGEAGDYVFVHVGEQVIGATMPQRADGPPPGWTFYFRAPDIAAAAAKVAQAGGSVVAGPMEVPGGERILVALDPHGVTFGVVGPGDDRAEGAAA